MTDMTNFKRNKMTDIEAIRAWYKDPEGFGELTEHQAEKRVRLLLIQSMTIQGLPNSRIVKMLMRDYSLSVAQAHRDCQQAIQLYGNIRKADKEGYRYILYEMALADRNKALANDDLKNAGLAHARMMKCIGVENEDADLPNFEKLEPSLNLIILSPGMEDRLNGLLSGGVVNFSEMRKIKEEKEAQEIEITKHEEIPNRSDDADKTD